MKDHCMDRALRKLLQRGRAEAAGPCPDENVLAAYLEARLSGAEVAALEAHVSDCPECRQTLALALKLSEAESVSHREHGKETRRTKARPFYRLPLPIIAAGLLLALGVTLYRVLYESAAIQTIESVANRAPASPEGKMDQIARLKESVTATGAGAAPVADKGEGAASPKILQAPPAGTMESREDGNEADAVQLAGVPKKELPALSDTAKTQGAAAVQMAPGKPQEQLAAQPEADRMKAVAGESESPAGQSVTSSLSQMRNREERLPLAQGRITGGTEGLRNVLRMLARGEPGPAETAQRRSGDRTFVRFSGYWLDLGCSEHPEAPVTELSRGGEEYKQLLVEIPLLQELLDSGIPVVIYRAGTIYLVP